MGKEHEQPIVRDNAVIGWISYSKMLKEWVALPVYMRPPLGFAEDRESAVELVDQAWRERKPSA